MAELGINIDGAIHAEILQGNFTMLSGTSVILDPITLSYSTYGKLIHYNLNAAFAQGVTNIRILNNGKNSRVSAVGIGYFQIRLYIKDDQGLDATDLITIIVE